MTERNDHTSLLILQSLERAKSLERRTAKLSRSIESQTARLKFHQTWRLAVAGLFFLGLFIATLQPEWKLEAPLIGIFLAVFSWLVVRTSRVRRYLGNLEGLRSFKERQRLRLLGRPSGRPWERAKTLLGDSADTTLPLPRDLCTIGSHSLHTLVDETLTDRGEKRLLEWLEPRPRPVKDILARQNLIQRLRPETWFYTRLTLIANAEEFRLSSSQILEFLKRPFVESTFPKLLALVLVAWLIMVLGVSAFFAGVKGFGQPGVFVVVFAALNFWALGRVGSTFKKGVGLETHLGLLSPIFARLENRTEARSELRAMVPTIATAGPSRETRRLTRVMSFLGVETNPILHLVINSFLPWTMLGSHFLERRRRALAESFPRCLDELAELEVLGTLLILDRYQTNTYPTFADRPFLDAKSLFHPLISRDQVIANDFSFPNGKSLGLLTGSNMAGKSTFLRTIGLNQLLAQMGAPVFAKSYVTFPFRIETCIEVSDSLRDGFSYFYAEVRRLRDLLRSSDTGEPVLYLIDEIFRGTNNRERHIGSRAVIKHLARNASSLGFISTHDLDLVNLEDSEPRLLNLHFREDFEEGRMVFHYRLRLGPCPTTNALKIMQAEGIAINE